MPPLQRCITPEMRAHFAGAYHVYSLCVRVCVFGVFVYDHTNHLQESTSSSSLPPPGFSRTKATPSTATPPPGIPALTANPQQAGRHSTSSSSAKRQKFVPLMSREGQTRVAMHLPGRHVCQCLGQKHELINNCVECGRIVCSQV